MDNLVAVFSRFTVFPELKDSLQQLGLEVKGFDSAAALRDLLSSGLHPALVLDINFHPELRAEAVTAGLPYTVWSFDSAVADVIAAEPGPWRRNDRFFLFNVHDAERARQYHDLVRYLPFSTGDRFILPPRREGLATDVVLVMNSYVETVRQAECDFAASMTAAKNDDERGLLELARALGELAIDRHLPYCDRDRLDEFLVTDIAACGIDPWNGNLNARRRFCRGIGQVLSFRQRENLVRSVAATGVNVAIYGDSHWQSIAAAYPNLVYHGLAAYSNLPTIYNQARIAVNLTQVQNLDSIPQRIYHLLAAGTLALSNGADALTEFFIPGHHLETFSGIDEMCGKIRTLTDDEDRRYEIAMAGHEEFLLRHRMTDRLRVICSESGLTLPPA